MPITASEARANLYRLIDETNESHRPVVIAGKRSSAVLVSAEDWDAIQKKKLSAAIRPVGDLDGDYSRRINIQHRSMYEVFKQECVLRVLRRWTHHE